MARTVKRYVWKCQSCGLSYEKCTKGEPRAPCPGCRDKGCKSFVKEVRLQVPNKAKKVAERLMGLDLEHSYICSVCATSRGAKWPEGHCATIHTAVCPYCEKTAGLANIGDWNWPDKRRRGMRD